MSYTVNRRFDQAVVIITGAASGIGLAVAHRLCREGAAIMLVDINADALEQAREELSQVEGVTSDQIAVTTADVSNEDDVRGYVDATMAKWGRIDGFFNNAGIDGNRAAIEDYPAETFDRVMSINTRGVFLGLKHVLEIMKNQGHGSIVNTASIGGIRGWARQYGYVASKHAVVGMTKAAAVEAGPHAVTVNALAPGGVRTQMAVEAMKKVNPDDPEAAEAKFCQGIPLARMARPEEIASAVAFLLSEDAAYISGQVLVADGGQTAKA